jgi:hypothetical protein
LNYRSLFTTRMLSLSQLSHFCISCLYTCACLCVWDSDLCATPKHTYILFVHVLVLESTPYGSSSWCSTTHDSFYPLPRLFVCWLGLDWIGLCTMATTDHSPRVKLAASSSGARTPPRTMSSRSKKKPSLKIAIVQPPPSAYHVYV